MCREQRNCLFFFLILASCRRKSIEYNKKKINAPDTITTASPNNDTVGGTAFYSIQLHWKRVWRGLCDLVPLLEKMLMNQECPDEGIIDRPLDWRYVRLCLSFSFFSFLNQWNWRDESQIQPAAEDTALRAFHLLKSLFFFPSFSLGRSPLSRRLFPYYLHRGESPPIPRLICASRSIPVSIPVLVANRDSQGDCSLSVLLFLA